MSDSDNYLIKLKQAGIDTKLIAGKLGMTESEVDARWNVLIATAAALVSNGYDKMVEHYNLLCSQYQLVGQSLAILSSALDKPVGVEELLECIHGTPTETATEILHRFMVLKPFRSMTPEELVSAFLPKN